MNLFCVGLSHHTANVETGNVSPAALARNVLFACRLRRSMLGSPTCNRVEVYGASENACHDEIAQCLLQTVRSVTPATVARCPFLPLRSEKWRTTSVPGCIRTRFDGRRRDRNSWTNKKKAYQSARASGAVGPCLHRLFSTGFRVAKQVRTHTEITRGSVSVGPLRLNLAQKKFSVNSAIVKSWFWKLVKRASAQARGAHFPRCQRSAREQSLK